ncbi:MAG: hypothetical protein A4E57_04147 [Syntrophorhabdaceae bacterium PtaU1.Bin034]|nr:MAG: hypothetical protein A4E57_04147 [Syntrophorhabdaceae bacterium PtaU1.Bin034]
MDQARDDVFPGACFPEKQHRAAKGTYALYHLDYVLQTGSRTHHILFADWAIEFFAQIPVVFSQYLLELPDLLVLQGIGEGNGKGLVQKCQQPGMLFRIPVLILCSQRKVSQQLAANPELHGQ